MNLYCAKCLKITKNNTFETKQDIDEHLMLILPALTMVLKDCQLLMRKK